ncbi:MAG: hypothetical protein ABW178_03880 [Pseudoxanthomonas sp.]
MIRPLFPLEPESLYFSRVPGATTMKTHHATLLLALALTISACQPSSTGSSNPVSQAMDEARKGIDEAQKGMQEAQSEIEKARVKLSSENLSLNQGKALKALPKAEITPQGDLLIEGKVVEATAEQKQLVLAYRGELLGVITEGMAIGIEGAKLGMDAAGAALKGLISNTPSDEIGKQVEKSAKERLKPQVEKLCARLPSLHIAQQALADKMPEFRPYATMDQADVDDCKDGGDWEF